MSIFICGYCGSERKSKKSLIGHETFCKANPDRKIQNTLPARQKALKLKMKCKWCGKEYAKANIKKHQNSCIHNPLVIETKTKICPICQNSFMTNATTCSYSCSNVYFRHSNEGGLRYKYDEELINSGRYRDVCFRYHEKKCVICGEENIVAVHHLNENHEDNRPENLIPLCPTHHQYYHSNFKYLVDKEIKEYIVKWHINNTGDEEAGSSAAFGAQRAGFDSPISDQQ